VIGDFLRQDDGVFRIHRGLHVVRRGKAVRGAHHLRFWFRIVLQLLQRRLYRTGIDHHFVLLIGLV
jgi:hypothetical protein